MQWSALASAPEPFDPMERALYALCKQYTDGAGRSVFSDAKLVKSYGIRPELLAMTQVWREPSGSFLVATKGAPEAISGLCKLSTPDQAAMRSSVETMAAEGMRVLGVARAIQPKPILPEKPAEFEFEFLGLVGFADPLRPSVPEAVRECRSAGIRVVMITGDYPTTALAIARAAGFEVSAPLTGEEINTLQEPEFSLLVRNRSVFARIMPEQKLRLVQALKADGQIVAMTGDGVNDAPSLKAAHIGIAMGGRGTDVAREASSIVLLDDDFGSIVASIRLGRRIYDNLRKAMEFIVAVHVPIAGLAILPLLFGLPIIFGPIHIAFLELVIDPVCSLVFEAEQEEDDVMRRPPRPPSEPLLPLTLIGWGALRGALVFGMVAAIFVFAFRSGLPEDEVRALAFVSLLLGIVSLIFVNRSFSASLITALRRPNPALLSILLGVGVMLALCMTIPLLRELFRFGVLHGDDLILTVGSALFLLIVLEFLKSFWPTAIGK